MKVRRTGKHSGPTAVSRVVTGAGIGCGSVALTGATLVTGPQPALAAVTVPHHAPPPVVATETAFVTTTTITKGSDITVRPGNTLSGLAAVHYGHANAWPTIYHANAKVKDPNLIYVGESLYIPAHASTTVKAVTTSYIPRHAAPSGNVSDAYNAFPGASCIVARESGGNAVAQNPGSTASGLFQDLDSTWNGYDGYAHAKDAPVSVQIRFNQVLSDWGRNLSPWAADGCPGTLHGVDLPVLGRMPTHPSLPG